MSITVNGEKLDPRLIEQEIEVLRQRYGERMSPDELRNHETQIISDARENAIERIILAQEARKTIPAISQAEVDRNFANLLQQYGQGASQDKLPAEEVAKMKDGISDSIKLERLFGKICKDVPAPTEEECLAFYNEHQGDFQSPEMVHASHILRQPSPNDDFGMFQAAMMNIREQAIQGTDFAQLARQNSSCNDNGGDLGWFPRGSMVESFEKIVFALEPGQVSDVFRTEFGYHIAKLHARRPSETLPFEKVRKDIRQTLLDQRKNDEIGRFVDKLRETAQIVEAPDQSVEVQK